jgi:hypothetical protein
LLSKAVYHARADKNFPCPTLIGTFRLAVTSRCLSLTVHNLSQAHWQLAPSSSVEEGLSWDLISLVK